MELRKTLHRTAYQHKTVKKFEQQRVCIKSCFEVFVQKLVVNVLNNPSSEVQKTLESLLCWVRLLVDAPKTFPWKKMQVWFPLALARHMIDILKLLLGLWPKSKLKFQIRTVSGLIECPWSMELRGRWPSARQLWRLTPLLICGWATNPETDLEVFRRMSTRMNQSFDDVQRNLSISDWLLFTFFNESTQCWVC